MFRHGNGVWGVIPKQIKDAIVIRIKANKKVGDRSVLKKIIEAIREIPQQHAEILINRKDIYMVLGNWAFHWANRYQRTTTGAEPTQWDLYRKNIKLCILWYCSHTMSSSTISS